MEWKEVKRFERISEPILPTLIGLTKSYKNI